MFKINNFLRVNCVRVKMLQHIASFQLTSELVLNWCSIGACCALKEQSGNPAVLTILAQDYSVVLCKISLQGYGIVYGWVISMRSKYMSHDLSKYTAVILCGGQGTRIRAVAEDRPKPMVDVGGRPILWHIMKIYSSFGVKKFVLALGHQGEKVVEYFENYHAHNCDFSMKVGRPTERTFFRGSDACDDDVDDWEITFAYTGVDTMTGGRVKRIKPYIKEDHFFCTYGDGVSDVDLRLVFAEHLRMGNVATMVGVHLPTTFGVIEPSENGKIELFREKPVLPGFINGGFFCFTPEIFDQIEGDATVLEDKPFHSLVKQGKIGMVPHKGFWHAMDHYKDYTTLNDMWKKDAAPWRVW